MARPGAVSDASRPAIRHLVWTGVARDRAGRVVLTRRVGARRVLPPVTAPDEVGVGWEAAAVREDGRRARRYEHDDEEARQHQRPEKDGLLTIHLTAGA